MRLDVGRDLGLQRRGQHLPGAVADDLIEQRPARHDVVLVRLHGVVDYLEHGRTFPNQRANAGPDQNQMTSDHPREGAPTHVTPPEGHPQVLIIAQGAERQAVGMTTWPWQHPREDRDYVPQITHRDVPELQEALRGLSDEELLREDRRTQDFA